ncbi:hypothetical protein BGW38_003760 [Lunasporangiospora selenospora]|uniref:Adhesin n=1 Tax=Lunasporangiospora selenospora TaxID=979761 RepID=A0A9P6KHP9_9FUNG|nr:hypothetical protein BGW38_003760 [Lunasporangiospora selenospora]
MSEHHFDFPADTKQNPTPLGALISQSYRNEALKKKQSRQRKRIALSLLSLILIGLAYFGFFYPPTRDYLDNFLHKKSSGLDQDWQSRFDAKQETLSKDRTKVKWDGPSSFLTKAQRFNLIVDGGKITGSVAVKKEPIDQVKLRFQGFIYYDNVPTKETPVLVHNYVEDEDILHRGLRIKIRETDAEFTATIHLEEEGDDGSGTKKPVKAHLWFVIVFPEHYTTYDELSIKVKPASGESIDIGFLQTLGLEFAKVDLGAPCGSIEIDGSLITENLDTFSQSTTNINEVAPPPGKTISIFSKALSDELSLNILTGPVDKGSTKVNKVVASSARSGVQVNVKPDPNLRINSDLKFAPIDLKAYSAKGTISSRITLADESQVLSFDAKTISGSVLASISDDFSGKLDLNSEIQEMGFTPKDGSKSEIVLQKETSTRILATKSLSSSPEVGRGKINLFTRRGEAKVFFV